MGKKGHDKGTKKKLTKKEQKAINHLELMKNKKGHEADKVVTVIRPDENKKAA